MADVLAAGFGLYIHWPFCASKCPYCDFNSHVAATIDTAEWRAAYLSEIGRVAALTGTRRLDSIFFGGGTPSLMDPDLVAAILDAADNAWTLAGDVEITLEANPTSVESGRFRAFRAAGVNRVSLGVQALNDPDLRRLGRLHSAAEARAAFDVARAAFDRVSFDLIYARQDQTFEAWRHELAEAAAMAADHLSLYQLTIEPGTAFGALAAAGRLRGLPDDDLSADMYLFTNDFLESAGLPGYEISNHARPGAEGRHNLIYWRSGDYAGIGPGAHGRLTLEGRRWATETVTAPADWLSQVRRDGHGETLRTEVTPRAQAAEYMMMALRLREGMDLDRYTRLLGHPPDEDAVRELRALGLLKLVGARLVATGEGRALLNGVLRRLLPEDGPLSAPS